jgi:hypothetical protein
MLNCLLLRRGRGRLGYRLRFGCFGLLARGKDGVQRGAFHAGHELDDSRVAHIHDEAIDDGVAELTVCHLTAFEAERRLDLVAFAEKADGLVLLGLIVVLVDGDRELHFLDDDDLLLLARRAIALVFLIEKLAVILNAANWRNGGGRNLNQVEAAFTRNLERLKGLHDAELLALIIDHANFARADAIVGANE